VGLNCPHTIQATGSFAGGIKLSPDYSSYWYFAVGIKFPQDTFETFTLIAGIGFYFLFQK
jgi:hypothetical protein